MKIFWKMIKEDRFLEHAEVFGNKYGTLKQPIIENLKKVKIFSLILIGRTSRTKRKRSKHLVSVFVLPPSIKN